MPSSSAAPPRQIAPDQGGQARRGPTRRGLAQFGRKIRAGPPAIASEKFGEIFKEKFGEKSEKFKRKFHWKLAKNHQKKI